VAASDPGVPGNALVFSRDRAARMPSLRRAATAVVLAGIAAAAGAGLGRPMFVIAGVLGLGAIGCVVSYVWQGRFRTVLTPQGLQLHGYVSHFIPWHEVAGFRVRHGQAGAGSGRDDAGPYEHIDSARPRMPDGGRQTGGPQPHVTVQVLRTGGRRLALPAPVVGGRAGDYQFTDRLRQLEEWRLRYGRQAQAPR
jgi:hypothetical protein